MIWSNNDFSVQDIQHRLGIALTNIVEMGSDFKTALDIMSGFWYMRPSVKFNENWFRYTAIASINMCHPIWYFRPSHPWNTLHRYLYQILLRSMDMAPNINVYSLWVAILSMYSGVGYLAVGLLDVCLSFLVIELLTLSKTICNVSTMCLLGVNMK